MICWKRARRSPPSRSSCAKIFPSRRNTTRRQQLAVKASWVTIRMVAPPLPVEHLQPLQQQPGGFGVQGPGGLVGQHQGGPGDDGPGGGAALLLSAGHLIGILVQTVPDAQQLRRLLHPVPDLGGRGAEDGQGQGNVFKGGKGVQQIAVLEDEAQPLPAEAGEGPAPQAGQLLPIHLDGTGGGPVDGGDAVEQGGLAGAGGPHDPHILPRLQGQVHAVQGAGDRPPLSIYLRQILYTQQLRHVGTPPFAGRGPPGLNCMTS